jgi:hypothetical protein
MKITFLLYLAIIFPTVVMASTSDINGCEIGDWVIPFTNFGQQGAARISVIQIEPGALVEYRSVWNQDSLSLVVNGKVIAFDSATMAPVQVHAEVNGIQVSCHVSGSNEAEAEVGPGLGSKSDHDQCQKAERYCRDSGGAIGYQDCMLAFGCDPYGANQ